MQGVKFIVSKFWLWNSWMRRECLGGTGLGMCLCCHIWGRNGLPNVLES